MLFCNAQGAVDRVWNIPTNTTIILPEIGGWLLGDRLYHTGMVGGLWNMQTKEWKGPRILSTVQTGFVRGNWIVYIDETGIGVLDVSSNVQVHTVAHPLHGQSPILWNEYAVWIEWGISQDTVVLWNWREDTRQEILAHKPISLQSNTHEIWWLETDTIQRWDGDVLHSTIARGVHSLTVTNDMACWSALGAKDLDIHCSTGEVFAREGNQIFPQIYLSVWEEPEEMEERKERQEMKKNDTKSIFFMEDQQIFRIIFPE